MLSSAASIQDLALTSANDYSIASLRKVQTLIA
jgi:hypothetical protein